MTGNKNFSETSVGMYSLALYELSDEAKVISEIEKQVISLIITGSDEKKAELESIKFKEFIEKQIKDKILGPVNAPIFRIKRKYRLRLLVRGRKSLNLQSSLSKIISKYKFPHGIKLTVDVDPINFN